MDSKPIYKTAEELGIEQWERDGLAALVGPLSRGVLQIDMTQNMCGTVGCVGGHLAVMNDKSPDHYVYSRAKSSLGLLYYPNSENGDTWYRARHPAWRCNAPQAARAIVNFLVTGDPQWDRVMSERA